MKTEKIINLLNDSSNEECKFTTKRGMSWTVKQQKINASKAILLNLKQKVLNLVCVINLKHYFSYKEHKSSCKQ